MFEFIAIELVPSESPIIFPEELPIFTAPAKTDMPQKIPGAVVVAVVLWLRLMALIELPNTSEEVAVPTVISMAKKRLAKAPA